MNPVRANSGWSFRELVAKYGEDVALEVLPSMPGLGRFAFYQPRLPERGQTYAASGSMPWEPTDEVHDEAPAIAVESFDPEAEADYLGRREIQFGLASRFGWRDPQAYRSHGE